MLESLKLDDLPVEILRTIALFTPAESILQLTQVNNALRCAFYDSIVFQSQVDFIHDLTPILKDDVQAWAQLAVACSYGRRWSGLFSQYDGDALSMAQSRLSRFVPHLLVLGHPDAQAQAQIAKNAYLVTPKSPHDSPQRTTRLTLRHKDIQAFKKTFNTASSTFWLCAAVFSRSSASSPFGQTDSDQPFSAQMQQDFLMRMNSHFSSRTDEIDPVKASLADVMGALAIWGWLLRDFLDAHPLTSTLAQPSQTSDARFTPCLEDLPWYRAIDRIPWPFAGPEHWNRKVDSNYRLLSWDEWLEKVVEDMSSAACLEKSLWCGYWSFEHSRRHGISMVEFADAVQGLHIHAMQYTDEPEPGSRRLIGIHADETVNFQLEGYITPKGRFKLGPPGEFWAWFGWMTPFGMFGFWGGPHGEEASGACWLWQAHWSNETNKKRTASSSSNPY